MVTKSRSIIIMFLKYILNYGSYDFFYCFELENDFSLLAD